MLNGVTGPDDGGASGTCPCGPARRSRLPYLGVNRRGQSRDRDGRGLSVPHAGWAPVLLLASFSLGQSVRDGPTGQEGVQHA